MILAADVIEGAATIDATPLLSTIVQSGAALVAIVAGLLVSRIVFAAGERVAAERRIVEANSLLALNREKVHRCNDELLRYDADDFLDDLFEHHARLGNGSFEYYWAEHAPRRSPRELKPFYDDFEKLIAEISEAAGRTFMPDVIGDEADLDNLRRSIPPGPKRRTVLRIQDLISENISDRSAIGFRPPSISQFRQEGIFTGQVLNARTRDGLAQAAAQADAELSLSEYELRQAARAVEAVSHPEGLRATTAVLLGITLTGMVAPLAQMSFGSAYISASGRHIYALLFLLSLVIFLLHIAVEIVRLSRLRSTSRRSGEPLPPPPDRR